MELRDSKALIFAGSLAIAWLLVGAPPSNAEEPSESTSPEVHGSSHAIASEPEKINALKSRSSISIPLSRWADQPEPSTRIEPQARPDLRTAGYSSRPRRRAVRRS